MRNFARLSVVLCLICFLAACSADSNEQGVVASVNGTPIYLHEVEARYDLDKLSWAAVYVPSVESLRKEYGAALSELIVNLLVNETLTEASLQVSDEELADAEAVVRADYPEGQFEKFMVEEYIDIDTWRVLLRQQLAMEKFKHTILRPRIKLTYQEAEAYYKEHLSDFYLPARVQFLLITGESRDQVAKARELYGQNPNADAVRKAFDAISVRELKMPRTRMPAAWATLLESLSPGDSSEVVTGGKGFESIVFQKELPAKVLDPTRAYPLVEKVLIEQKLEKAFNEWLKAKLSTSDIRITTLLLEKVRDDITDVAMDEDVKAGAPVVEREKEQAATNAVDISGDTMAVPPAALPEDGSKGGVEK